jgi:hypothetical protein
MITRIAASALLLGSSIALAIPNGGWEFGSNLGWSTIGSTPVKTAAFGITPTQGVHMGHIETTGNFTAGAPAVAAALGLTGPAIAGLGQGSPINGSAIYRTFLISAGQTLSFNWNFVSDELTETPTFNDFAFMTINSGTPSLLASRNTSTWNFVSPPPGFDAQTNWAGYSQTFAVGGSYTFGFAALNVGDAGHNSALLLDNFQLSPVPEPTTAALVVSGAVFLRRKRFRSA